MNSNAFKPTAYVLNGCPFSFKFWLFMVEAGMADAVEIVRCDPSDASFEQTQAKLAQGLGKKATFPTVEVEPGRYRSDSDALIEYFAGKNGVDVRTLPALAFYKQTVLPQVVELHELKSAK